MGLSARKQKQRIGPDPRNLTWAENASRFGQQYLAKFGWSPDSGTGLGADGTGRVNHVTVAQKLNLMGIGGGNGPGGPDDIAWKQNRDFENVLKKLNNAADNEDDQSTTTPLQGFVGSSSSQEVGSTEREEKKKRKEERRKRKEEVAANIVGESSTPQEEAPAPKSVGRPLAHRAKFRASKNLASMSSTALSEILGIASSSTPSTPVRVSTPSQTTSSVVVDQLKTSTTSVADYFAAKLKARKLQSETPVGTPREEEEQATHERVGKKEKKRKREEFPDANESDEGTQKKKKK